MAAGDLSKYIIEGLPVEFAAGKCSMYSPFAAASPEGMLTLLRQHAHGIGFQ
jgi:hypothetical protein